MRSIACTNSGLSCVCAPEPERLLLECGGGFGGAQHDGAEALLDATQLAHNTGCADSEEEGLHGLLCGGDGLIASGDIAAGPEDV